MYFFEALYSGTGSDSDLSDLSDLGRILDSTWDSPMGINWSSSD